MTLFVNVEPEVLGAAPLADLLRLAEGAPAGLRVVLEITKRALATRPADLLQTVARVRDLGWAVALDDVGAEPASLTFMSLLRPDVVKLDLRLVQERPSRAVAEIMHAVNAYAEGSGALLLAEGIRDPRPPADGSGRRGVRRPGLAVRAAHRDPRRRRQWPAPGAARTALPSFRPRREAGIGAKSPFDCLPASTPRRRSRKRLLIEISHALERQAATVGATCLVAAAFQHRRHFTPDTARGYARLVERTGLVCVLGEGLPREPVPGVRGADVAAADPLCQEWDVVVLSPHFSAALLAQDLGDDGPDEERTFEHALTYRRVQFELRGCVRRRRYPDVVDGVIRVQSGLLK